MIWLIVLIVVVLLLVVLAIAFYNRLVRYRNRVDNAWAQIEVQLKRRWDLIPNLVETVKGYAAHERGTFEEVTAARTRAQQAQTQAQTAEAEGILGQALGRLFAVAEAYPQLRATENFQQLQAQLEETESKIAVSRQVYNDSVLTYDNALETVPTNIIGRNMLRRCDGVRLPAVDGARVCAVSPTSTPISVCVKLSKFSSALF